MKKNILENLVILEDNNNQDISETVPNVKKKRRKLTPLKTDGFIQGPIPLEWLDPIFKSNKTHLFLPALTVWHLSKLKKESSFAFQYSLAEKFGQKKATIRNALFELKRLGLISLITKNGNSPHVKLNLPIKEYEFANN